MRSRFRIRPVTLVRVVAPLALLGLLVLAVPRSPTAAETPKGWQVGDPIVQPLPEATPEAQAVASAAAGLTGSLGLEGSPAPPVREQDLRTGQAYDRVEYTLADGTPGATVEVDPATGLPILIVRYDQPEGWDTPATTPVTAADRGRGFVAAAGLPAPSGAMNVSWDEGMGSWQVSWPRTASGYAVPGDGVFVNVFRGGQFAGLSVFDSPLAAIPVTLITPAQARSAALAAVTRSRTARGITAATPVVEWRAPNNLFDPTKSDAPDYTLVLVYRVPLTIDGDEPLSIDVFVDAGTGAVVGGAESA